MARPRQPAQILELKGAFKKHPERRRQDLAGAGPFDSTPPSTLAAEHVAAWREIVLQINPTVLTASDRTSIELMAILLVQVRSGDMKAISELRQWFGQYGLTAAARAKIAAPKKADTGNAFADA